MVSESSETRRSPDTAAGFRPIPSRPGTGMTVTYKPSGTTRILFLIPGLAPGPFSRHEPDRSRTPEALPGPVGALPGTLRGFRGRKIHRLRNAGNQRLGSSGSSQSVLPFTAPREIKRVAVRVAIVRIGLRNNGRGTPPAATSAAWRSRRAPSACLAPSSAPRASNSGMSIRSNTSFRVTIESVKCRPIENRPCQARHHAGLRRE